MKKLLLVALATIIFSSCEKKPVKDYFVISGKIDNFRKRNIELKGYNFTKKVKFDRKTKMFSDTIRNLKSGQYMLQVDKMPIMLYLTPTEDIVVNADYKKRATQAPTFEGTNAPIGTYLNKKRGKFGMVLGSAVKFFSLDEQNFLDKNDEYQSELLSLLNSAGLSADFVELEKNNISYEHARNLYNYQKYHRTVTGNDEFEVTDDFPNPLEDVNFNNNTDYTYSSQYRKLLTEHLYSVAEKKLPEDGDFYLTYLETIQTEVTDTLVKNDLIHKISEDALTYTTNLKEFYRKYMGYSTSDKNKREITDLYNKLKLTARGMPSPKFKDYENYNGGTTSLDDLIGKGKYLYIDIWATWCGFCKKEIPLLKNFEVKYHGKNIDFVSISVDKPRDKAKWKREVKDREMGGYQLFAGASHLDLKFTQDYLIKGLPRFILLDPDGKIITANAPRPSEGDKLEAIFEQLGIEEAH